MPNPTLHPAVLAADNTENDEAKERRLMAAALERYFKGPPDVYDMPQPTLTPHPPKATLRANPTPGAKDTTVPSTDDA